MTLIECFVNSPLDNIATAICLKPKKIVFIGYTENSDAVVDRYRHLLERKGVRAQISFKKTAMGSFLSAEKIIRDVICAEKDCVLDITGGQEAVLMAAGALYNELENTHPFKILRFDPDSSLMVDAVTGQKNIGSRAWLSVSELIYLHGGSVTSSNSDILPPQSKRDLDMLWQVVSTNPENWNKTITNLHEFQNKSGADGKTNNYCLDFDEIEKKTVDFEEKSKRVRPLLKSLADKGLLVNFSQRQNTFRYTYKNSFIKNCLNKEGNMLELKTYATAFDLPVQNGNRYFDDCKMSVSIDWDGKINGTTKDTNNEIDVIAMRGCRAFFISCKNGEIGDAEIYKLSTVASKFGGKYSRKMLVSTDFRRDSEDSKQSFRQRCIDMNTKFGEDVARFKDSDWEKFFKDC